MWRVDDANNWLSDKVNTTSQWPQEEATDTLENTDRHTYESILLSATVWFEDEAADTLAQAIDKRGSTLTNTCHDVTGPVAFNRRMWRPRCPHKSLDQSGELVMTSIG